MGEATNNLSKDFRAAHTDIPWTEIAGMRDRLIHGYRKVRLLAVWQTVQDDLPALRKQLAPLLPSRDPPPDAVEP